MQIQRIEKKNIFQQYIFKITSKVHTQYTKLYT